MLTKPRTDLPTAGEQIAVLHGSGQFYVGPMTVVAVDAPRLEITLHPLNWPPKNFIVHRPHREEAEPMKWNRVDDLSEQERAGLAIEIEERPGVTIEARATEPQTFSMRSISGRADPVVENHTPPGLPMRAREKVPDLDLSNGDVETLGNPEE
jgi:hypothetical protein